MIKLLEENEKKIIQGSQQNMEPHQNMSGQESQIESRNLEPESAPLNSSSPAALIIISQMKKQLRELLEKDKEDTDMLNTQGDHVRDMRKALEEIVELGIGIHRQYREQKTGEESKRRKMNKLGEVEMVAREPYEKAVRR